MRSAAIIQARMGSSRLPGKVLKPLAGKPVLQHVRERVSASQLIDQVIVATSDLAGDDPIEAFCEVNGWRCIRGPEADVLARYAKAAKTANADVIVRITSDCPLFSPAILDEMLAKFDPETMDYMSTNWPERTFPVGLDCEVMRAQALLDVADHAADPYDREHVTAHFYRYPDGFRLAGHACKLKLDHLRITLDTAEDYERLVTLLAKRPELADPATDVIESVVTYFNEQAH